MIDSDLQWEKVWHAASDTCYEARDYQVYDWKGDWAVYRPAHAVLDLLYGQYGFNTRFVSVLAAQRYCAEDWQKRMRLTSWLKYITEHDPPSGEE